MGFILSTLRVLLDSLTVSRVKILYIKTVLVTKMINRESNASSIPELTGFNVSHSALTRQVFLNATFTDNMASLATERVTCFVVSPGIGRKPCSINSRERSIIWMPGWIRPRYFLSTMTSDAGQ
jgi:hypothetical protein